MSVTEFRDGEDGNAAYLAWTAANGHGYVINIQRSLNPSDARLHRAVCDRINGTPPRGRGFVGSYIKICSETLDELRQWAVAHVGSEIQGCGTCRPAGTQDRSRPSPRVPRAARPTPRLTLPRTDALGVAPVTAVELDRLVDAYRGLPVRAYAYEQQDYMTNVLLTVLDLQMHNRAVERSIRHYWDRRQEQVRTLDDLGGLLARFPDDKEGNRAVARYLWGNDHWTRVHWLRGFARFLAEEDLRTQEALTAWARRSDYDRDFAGRVKYLVEVGVGVTATKSVPSPHASVTHPAADLERGGVCGLRLARNRDGVAAAREGLPGVLPRTPPTRGEAESAPATGSSRRRRWAFDRSSSPDEFLSAGDSPGHYDA